MLSKSRFLSHIFGYRQYSSAQLSRSELDIRLRNLNLKEVQVIGDGNCQFRSIGGALGIKDHRKVRYDITQWLRRNRDYSPTDDETKLKDFIMSDEYNSWEDFCNMMSINGTYGDHVTLIAASENYDTEINVITTLRVPDSMAISVIKPKRRNPKHKIYLVHYHELHYNYCIPYNS